MTTTSLAKADSIDDVLLNKGDLAPFPGVLVSPDNYRQFTISSLENKDFKDNMDKEIKCDPPPLIPKSDVKSFAVGFLIGVAVTALTVMAVK